VKELKVMQAYEGYIENGHFFPAGQTMRVKGRRRAFITILDEPTRDDETTRRLAALDKFFSEIEACDEEVPEFERVKFREDKI
jgi:hypothetical protein